MALLAVILRALLLANAVHSFVLPGIVLPTNVMQEHTPSEAVITPAPTPPQAALDLLRRQQEDDIDPASLANVLLSDVPQSLLELAATNVPALSRLLWSEFLDDNTPSWFVALPSDVQSYLSGQYGPESIRAKTTSADEESSTPTPLATTVIQTSMVTLTPSPASTNSIDSAAPAPTASTDDNGLTTTQKIGIGVGVPVGVAAIAALFLCCFLLRRRRKHQRKNLVAKDVNDRVPTPAFLSSSNRHPPMGERADNALLMHGAAPVSDDSREIDDIDTGYYGHGHALSNDGPYAAARPDHNNIGAAYDRHNNPYDIPPIPAKNTNGASYRGSGANGNAANLAAGMLVAPPRRARNGNQRTSRNSTSLGSLGSVPEAPEHAEYTAIPAGGAVLPDRTLRRSHESWGATQVQPQSNGYAPLTNGNGSAHAPTSSLPPAMAAGAPGVRRKSLSASPPDARGVVSPLDPSPNAQADTHPAFRTPPVPAPSPPSKSPFADEYADVFYPSSHRKSSEERRYYQKSQEQVRGWDANRWGPATNGVNGVQNGAGSYDSPTLGVGEGQGEDWPLRGDGLDGSVMERGRPNGKAKLYGSAKESDGGMGERRPLWGGPVYDGT